MCKIIRIDRTGCHCCTKPKGTVKETAVGYTQYRLCEECKGMLDRAEVVRRENRVN